VKTGMGKKRTGKRKSQKTDATAGHGPTGGGQKETKARREKKGERTEKMGAKRRTPLVR